RSLDRLRRRSPGADRRVWNGAAIVFRYQRGFTCPCGGVWLLPPSPPRAGGGGVRPLCGAVLFRVVASPERLPPTRWGGRRCPRPTHQGGWRTGDRLASARGT